MELRLKPINQKSYLPVHVQLKEQLKHLILSGELEVGERLPSIRALAGYLRINRNTVARVVAELEREEYVETRRGSGVFVVEPPAGREDLKRQRLLERVMEQARAEGVSVEDLGYELLARAGAPVREKVRIAFAECNRPQVEQFSAELEEQLPVEVEGLLIEELENRLGGEQEPPWRLVATTFFHVQEVEALAEPRGIEAVALMVEATVGTISHLSELPAGTTVGVVGNSPACTRNLTSSLQGAGLENLEIQTVEDYRDTQRLRDVLARARVVVCGAEPAARIAEMDTPEQLRVIVEDRTLEKAGIEMLGRMIRA